MRSQHGGPALSRVDTAFSLHPPKARSCSWSAGGLFSTTKPGGKTQPNETLDLIRGRSLELESPQHALGAALFWWKQVLAASG